MANFLKVLAISKYGKTVTAKQIEETARFTWDYQQTHNRIQQLVKNGCAHQSKKGT